MERLYVGANIGAGWTDTNWSWPTASGFAPFGPASDHFTLVGHTLDQSETNVTGGLQVGYQQTISNLLAGIEVGYTVVSAHLDTTSPIGSPFHAFPTQGPETQSANVKNIITITPRLGWVVDRWMPYVKGGYAVGKVEASSADRFGGGTDEHWLQGYTLGGGVEYRITTNVSFAVEYDYTHLDSETFMSGIVGGSPADPKFFRADLEATEQAVTARLNLRLGPAAVQ